MSNIGPGMVEVIGQDPYMDYYRDKEEAEKKKTSAENTIGIINAASTGLTSIAQSIFGGGPTRQTDSGTPPWLIPVAIGGVGILGLAIITSGKKKGRRKR